MILFSPLQMGVVGGEHAPREVDLAHLFVIVSKDGRSQAVSLRDLIDEIKSDVVEAIIEGSA